jgi:hypothetical protein
MVAARQDRWCSEGIAERPVCQGNSRSLLSETTRLSAQTRLSAAAHESLLREGMAIRHSDRDYGK